MPGRCAGSLLQGRRLELTGASVPVLDLLLALGRRFGPWRFHPRADVIQQRDQRRNVRGFADVMVEACVATTLDVVRMAPSGQRDQHDVRVEWIGTQAPGDFA